MSAVNPLVEVQKYGQSLWYDNIRRALITSGELKALVDHDGLRGVTSNPAIFEKAIAGSTDYDGALKALEGQGDHDAKTLYEHLAVADIQSAADVLRPVYEQTRKRDGYISLEVSPYLANDTAGTLDEARRLWKAVNRPNLMIKVPGTAAGVPAIQTLISEGINVNVTLLFSQQAYERVAEAYLSGLEALAKTGKDVSGVASVASFFISRIDSLADSQIEAALKGASGARAQQLSGLLGQVAIANAKLTYQYYKTLYAGPRWQALAVKGAQTQRLLWASTSTKNPKYRDVIYVEELIGPDTVNTVPTATFNDFRDHGKPRASLEENIAHAREVMDTLGKVGLSMQAITAKLLEDGVALFADAFDKLLGAVEQKRRSLLANKLGCISYKLPAELDTAVKGSLEEWRKAGKIRKLWARDKSLWTGADEDRWLGWLDIVDQQLENREQFTQLAAEVKADGFTHVALLGMGGSSLCPEVMSLTYGPVAGFPVLHILDSTDPQQIAALEKKLDLKKTLFFVSSKSGTTLEPNIYYAYFHERMKKTVGEAKAGQHFIAITDPGSHMVDVAKRDGHRRIYYGLKTIGGRYSALSNFGMIPAAAMGVDVPRFLERTAEMVHACASCVPATENHGVVLGTIMGVLARGGRDKVTLITSPAIGDLGAWLEQLLAESTGKIGKGLIPVDLEPLAAPAVYGADRLFAYVRLDGATDPAQEAAVAALEAAGQPVVRLTIADRYELGQMFFCWEIATAVAGAIIGINAFDQPDVEAAKVAARELTSAYEKTGHLPPETPFFEGEGVKLFSDKVNADAVVKSAGADKTLVGMLRAHLSRLQAGDYLCLNAYVEMNEAHAKPLQAIRVAVRAARKNATCLGFGPRFLHSTGQAYKGGPNSGVFIQVTADDAADLPVPGQKYTFGVVKAAQARGDFNVLADRKRRALRVHLGKDVAAGLAALQAAVAKALG